MFSRTALSRQPSTWLRHLQTPRKLDLAPVSLAESAGVQAAGLWARRAGSLVAQRSEHLVVFLPVPILPMVGSLPDLLVLAVLYLVAGVLEAVHRPEAQPLDHRQGLAVAAAAWLVAGFVLGAAAALTLALFSLVRLVENRAPASNWPLRAALSALACVVLVDLALVTLGLERSSLWLALAAAMGLAAAAGRRLGDLGPAPGIAGLEAAAAIATKRARLETLLLAAAVLILALYGALLAHEPALGQLAGTGRFLALPLLAAALGRLVWLTLETRFTGIDPAAAVLLAAWFTASLALGGS
jgi:hypothetical protein